MINVQVVSNGVVSNTILFQDGSVVSSGSVALPGGGVVSAAPGESFYAQSGAGIGWVVSNGSLVAPPPVAATYTKDELVAEANTYQWALATGGHNMTVEGTSYLFPTDSTSLSLMTGKAVRLQMPGAPTTQVNWQLPSGFVSMSVADFLEVAAALADWVQSTFDALSPVLAAIQAGTISDPAHIASASWPTR